VPTFKLIYILSLLSNVEKYSYHAEFFFFFFFLGYKLRKDRTREKEKERKNTKENKLNIIHNDLSAVPSSFLSIISWKEKAHNFKSSESKVARSTAPIMMIGISWKQTWLNTSIN
jgi:hypothetical protein